MSQKTTGIIGGSGLYDMPGLKVLGEEAIRTPFGDPSDKFILGELEGKSVVFLPRHGKGHRLGPSELNFRANIWGMKKLGVSRMIGVSAVGSMQEEIAPGDMVIIDQFIDRTKARASTFFENGIVAHISFADPLCSEVRTLLIDAGKKVGARVHENGTYICMEGPQFSTYAESQMYRQWGADVIGMTNLQEAKLAREAEICYATIALSTDYDCWHETHDDVTGEAILEVMHKNVDTAKLILKEAVLKMGEAQTCKCGSALKSAIFTDPNFITDDAKKRLEIITGKYFSAC